MSRLFEEESSLAGLDAFALALDVVVTTERVALQHCIVVRVVGRATAVAEACGVLASAIEQAIVERTRAELAAATQQSTTYHATETHNRDHNNHNRRRPNNDDDDDDDDDGNDRDNTRDDRSSVNASGDGQADCKNCVGENALLQSVTSFFVELIVGTICRSVCWDSPSVVAVVPCG